MRDCDNVIMCGFIFLTCNRMLSKDWLDTAWLVSNGDCGCRKASRSKMNVKAQGPKSGKWSSTSSLRKSSTCKGKCIVSLCMFSGRAMYLVFLGVMLKGAREENIVNAVHRIGPITLLFFINIWRCEEGGKQLFTLYKASN